MTEAESEQRAGEGELHGGVAGAELVGYQGKRGDVGVDRERRDRRESARSTTYAIRRLRGASGPKVT